MHHCVFDLCSSSSSDSTDGLFSDRQQDEGIDRITSDHHIYKFTFDFSKNTLMNLWVLLIVWLLFYTVICFYYTKKQGKYTPSQDKESV